MRLRFSAFARIILCGSIVLLCVAAASAQFRAGIQGTVTDPQGGAVSDATITVTNKETAKAQQVTSSGEGFYRVTGLPPATYTVTAEKTGYKKKVLESVSVAAETTQGLDIALEVGEVSATVTVSGEGTTALQTENATIGGSISTREVLRLPQVGRDPYQLIRLAPGVFGQGAFIGQGNAVRFPNGGTGGDSGGNIFSTENRPEISAGGQRVESNNIQIDGVNAMSQNWGGSAVITPNQESVKEVRVLATNYSA
ncbi:MAG: carboxypeptidase-like regulatory domain-containing protein, partial [Acidobacteria bacterium]|nr:carboxypeptidase-like regulatory domain-containing protein [Acidobacteriota bacterium]